MGTCTSTGKRDISTHDGGSSTLINPKGTPRPMVSVENLAFDGNAFEYSGNGDREGPKGLPVQFACWSNLRLQAQSTNSLELSASVIPFHAALQTSVTVTGESSTPTASHLSSGRAASYTAKQEVLITIALKETATANEMISTRKACVHSPSRFLLQLHEAFQDASRLYLVTEPRPRVTLKDITLGRPLPLPSIQYHAACVVLALKHLHSSGLAHTQVHPQSVGVSADGRTKLYNLSQSKHVDLKWSPEEAWRLVRCVHRDISHDWYDFGRILFFLATGTEFELPQTPSVKAWRFSMQKYEPRGASHLPGDIQGREIRKLALERHSTTAPPEVLVLYEKLEAVPDPLRSLIAALLIENPNIRLGAQGANGVMNHAFFRGMGWNSLSRGEVPPPAAPRASASKPAREITSTELVPLLPVARASSPTACTRYIHAFDFDQSPYGPGQVSASCPSPPVSSRHYRTSAPPCHGELGPSLDSVSASRFRPAPVARKPKPMPFVLREEDSTIPTLSPTTPAQYSLKVGVCSSGTFVPTPPSRSKRAKKGFQFSLATQASAHSDSKDE